MIKKSFFLVITVLGIVILYSVFSIRNQAREGMNWPQTKGQVLSTSLVINHLPKFIDLRDDPTRWFGAQIRYGYTVGNEDYESDRLSFLKGDTRDPQVALKIMNKYRHEHEITVYYDPKDPQKAVLQPGYIGDIYIPLLLGAFLTLIGLFNIYRFSLEYRGKEKRSIEKGHDLQNSGKLEEAMVEYNQFIRSNPYLAVGYSSRGSLYLHQKDWDRAIDDFKRVIAIEPKNAFIYYSLANAYLGNKQYDQALENMKKAEENGFKINRDVLEVLRKKYG
jgi:tetratricopeptide (TPR) repeat protein